MAGNLTINVGAYADVPADTLRLTTISPGGCGELTWTHATRPPYLGLMDLKENDRVEVFDGTGLVWRGRLEVRRPAIQYGTGEWTLTALGYCASLRDQFYATPKIYGGGIPVDEVFKGTRTDLCPDISASNLLIGPTGRTLAGATRDLIDLSAQQIFEEAVFLGGAAGDEPLQWHIWEGRPGSSQDAALELRLRPTEPAYTVGLSQGVALALEYNLTRFYSRVIVKWQTDAEPPVVTRTVVNNTTAQGPKPAGYGLIATKHVDSRVVANATDATTVANTILTRFARVHALAQTIVIPGSAIIEDADGSAVAPWRVRAGGIIRIRELRAGGIAGPDYDFMSATTAWDDRANVLTITPEGHEDVAHVIARYLREEHLT